MKEQVKMLLYGYGDTAKQDDGIGCECASCIEKWIREEQPGLSVETLCRAQIDPYDSEVIAGKDIVIFIDSSRENISDFYLTRASLQGDMKDPATPGHLLHLCKNIYKKIPMAFILHIKGYKWREASQPSQKASANLIKALQYLKEKIMHPEAFVHVFEDKCSIDLA